MNTAMEVSVWKEEPLSPVFSELEEQIDVWDLFKDEVAEQPRSPVRSPLGTQGGWLPDSPGDSCDSMEIQKLEDYATAHAHAQLASQLLEDLDEVLIKDEPFATWYEPKTDLPMFEELPSPTPSFEKEDALAGASHRPFAGLALSMPLNGYVTAVPAPVFVAPAAPEADLVPLGVPQQQQQPVVESLQQLVPGADALGVGLLAAVRQPVIHDTKTLLEEFDFVFGKVGQSHGGALTPPQSPPHAQFQQEQPACHQAVDDFAALSANQQLIREVDELVKAQQVEPQAWSLLAPPSPCTSSSSSYSCSTGSPAPASPETDDPEWLPSCLDGAQEAVEAPGKAAPAKRRSGKRSSKPYSHEDKRMRKKEQNKNAATRYRMKKKAEVEEILGEENELQRKNDDLKAKVGDLSQEIRYLKNLMREVLTRRGLLK